MSEKYLILDFDSTIIEVEALDELAALALAGQAEGEKIVKEIARITDLGMEGKMPVEESLGKRLELLSAGRKEVEALVPMLKGRLSPSFRKNRAFFEEHRDRIFVISNGFKEIIVPVVEEIALKAEQVCANVFKFDQAGDIIGYDRTNLLAQKDGKAKQLEALGLAGDIYVIGDGMTDYHMTHTGLVTAFVAYMGNVHREAVAAKADYVIQDFDQFLDLGLF